MTLRNCDYCGEPYEAKRLNSRFCSPAHRMSNHRKPASPPPRLPSVTADEPDGPVLARARAALEVAGRLDTWEGAVALQMSARLDAQVREGGMGLAAVVREHRAAMAEALKGAHTAADPVDELRERRARRRAG